jgi:hypothetical protein
MRPFGEGSRLSVARARHGTSPSRWKTTPSGGFCVGTYHPEILVEDLSLPFTTVGRNTNANPTGQAQRPLGELHVGIE